MVCGTTQRELNGTFFPFFQIPEDSIHPFSLNIISPYPEVAISNVIYKFWINN